jgi:tetratricopeptide (TPR) repeat protein
MGCKENILLQMLLTCMYNRILLSALLLLWCTGAGSQGAPERTLFIIDSIPIINDPEKWNPITNEDISDIREVKDRDSLKLLGWADMDKIIYVFTKAYRSRPDSVRLIPGLKQLKVLHGVWTQNGMPYSGTYIDYYNSGKMLNRGTLVDGLLHGEVTVFFKNGNKKQVAHYRHGLLHGPWQEYYPNGMLLHHRQYADDKVAYYGSNYFITGQLKDTLKRRKATAFDTSIAYYSNGKVKQQRLIQHGVQVPDERQYTVAYQTAIFYGNLQGGSLREANKALLRILKADSTSDDTHFKEGLLLMMEMRYDKAVSSFDKALQAEPLMREALVHRAMARMYHYRPAGATKGKLSTTLPPLTAADLDRVPPEEGSLVCQDLRAAEALDFSELYVSTLIPQDVLKYCRAQ